MAQTALVWAPLTCNAAEFSGRSSFSSQLWRSRAFTPSAVPLSLMEKHAVGVTVRRMGPVAVLPLFSLAAEQEIQQIWTHTSIYTPVTIDEITLKNIYLVFGLFFVWGCCVFGAMNDPFYDSDVYRDAGGDGTGNWIYQLEEEEEVNAREELWREELVRELEERVGELREIEEAEKEKEEELV